jgi:toxin ParE1/3/4
VKLDVIIEADAKTDLKSATDWYNKQLDGLGLEFLVAVEAALSGLELNPERFQKIFKEIRRAPVDRFPFGIFYIISNLKVYVIAFMHYKRSPGDWIARY